jgi:SAM-dependent methyltransferase
MLPHHPIQVPSGIARVAGPEGDVGSAHRLDVLVLDQMQSWGWDDILFVECGDGWAAEEAWRRRRTRGHVVALDRSPGAIERASRLRGVVGRVEFATWDGRQLCQENEAFDQLISSFAFQRSPNPEALACEMLRVLRPAGELYALEAEIGSEGTRKLLTSAGFLDIDEFGHLSLRDRCTHRTNLRCSHPRARTAIRVSYPHNSSIKSLTFRRAMCAPREVGKYLSFTDARTPTPAFRRGPRPRSPVLEIDGHTCTQSIYSIHR